MSKQSMVWPAVIAVLIVLVIANTLILFNVGTKSDDKDVCGKECIAQALATVAANQQVPNIVVSVPENNKTELIYDKLFEEDQKEDVALKLALDELNTKDFKKIVQEVLNDNGQNVESYKDVKSFSVVDSDVELSGDEAEVTLEVKVKFFNDGDSDSEDIETAKVEVVLSVSDLDKDESYEDSEVDSYDSSDFDFVKVYD